MILEGHRSIVNQIRYNHHAQILASSGVEKVIKVGCSERIVHFILFIRFLLSGFYLEFRKAFSGFVLLLFLAFLSFQFSLIPCYEILVVACLSGYIVCSRSDILLSGAIVAVNNRATLIFCAIVPCAPSFSMLLCFSAVESVQTAGLLRRHHKARKGIKTAVLLTRTVYAVCCRRWRTFES